MPASVALALLALAGMARPPARSTSVPTEDRLRALDEITLPMSGKKATLDLEQSHLDALPVRDLAASINPTPARLARVSALTQAADQLLTQLTASHQTYLVADRFA